MLPKSHFKRGPIETQTTSANAGRRAGGTHSRAASRTSAKFPKALCREESTSAGVRNFSFWFRTQRQTKTKGVTQTPIATRPILLIGAVLFTDWILRSFCFTRTSRDNVNVVVSQVVYCGRIAYSCKHSCEINVFARAVRNIWHSGLFDEGDHTLD